MGDDGKVWALSSNPAIHDWPLAVRILDRLYGEALAAQVDPEVFSERLCLITEAQARLEDDALRDARAGILRRPRRVLP